MFKFAFDAIGTSWEIETPHLLSIPLQHEIVDRIEQFEATYSRFRADSLVTRIASAADGGRFEFPWDSIALFDLYDRLHACTSGAVDPLIGRDLDILRTHGLEEFVVDASGDLIRAGEERLDVGLEHPCDPSLAIGVAYLNERALCASAVNRRAWRCFHHVIDGRTGVPVRDVIATWVVADDAMTADGLATALFFTTPDRLLNAFRFSFVRMFEDGRAEVSSDFDGELFT